MAYLPPVTLPDVGQQRDYAGQLHGMISNVGDAVLQNRRFKVGDEQWAQEQERLSTAQALAQSNADRNYAQGLAEFEWKKQQDLAGGDEFFAPYEVYNPTDGTWSLVQAGKSGGPARTVQLEEGLTVQPRMTPLNTGPNFDLRSTRGGIPMGGGDGSNIVPIDNATVAGDKELGGIRGAAQGILPQAKIQTEYVSQKISEVMSDPNLGLVTGGGGEGGFGGILPTWASVSAETRDKGREAQSRLQFVKDQVFPLAYDLIRGAGPIAIYESQAAAAALSRLNDQALSDADYIEALGDFDVKIKLLLKAIEAKAGGGGSEAAPAQGGGAAVTSPGGVQFQKVGQ